MTSKNSFWLKMRKYLTADGLKKEIQKRVWEIYIYIYNVKDLSELKQNFFRTEILIHFAKIKIF